VVSIIRNIMTCIEAWIFADDGIAKALFLAVMLWASFGAGYYQGRKVAEREALQQLAKLMLEEKAAK
jgi:hypothetical protein